jgi:predicted transcriptional regulator
MGQEEVFRYLNKRKKRWITSLEFVKNMDITLGNINLALNKLFAQGLIEKRVYLRTPQRFRGKMYEWKVRDEDVH